MSFYENVVTKETEDIGGSGNSLGHPAWINLQANAKPHRNKMSFGFSADSDRIIPSGFSLNEDDPEQPIWEADELTCVILGYRISKMAKSEAGDYQRFGFFESRASIDSQVNFSVDRVASSIQLLVLPYSPDLTVDNFEDYITVIGTSAASAFASLTNSLTHRIGSTRDGRVMMYQPRSMAGRDKYFWTEVGEGIIPELLTFLRAEEADFKAATGKDTRLGLGQHWVTLRAQDDVIKVGDGSKRSFVSLPTIDTSTDENGMTLMDMKFPEDVPALAHRYVGGILDNTLDKYIRNNVDDWAKEWTKDGKIGGKPQAATDAAGDEIIEEDSDLEIPF